MGIRLILVVGAFALMYGSLGMQFYNLQIRRGAFYDAQAASQSVNQSPGPARGHIFTTDKNNALIPVAINKRHPFIYAIPERIAKAEIDIAETAAILADLLAVPLDRLTNRLNRPNDPFEELLRFAPNEIVAKIKELNIPGIYVGERSKRYYPYGSMMSHILGFVANNRGQYGIEAYYNKKLSGAVGAVFQTSPANSRDGSNVYLTIDQNIQAYAEKILTDTIDQFNAKGGLVIVSSPKTGAIKAMAGMPSFDPNNFGSAEMSSYINPATQAIYEPGSVFKLITMAAALDAGVVTPDTTYIDHGRLTIDGRTIRNWDHKAHGRLTMSEVIGRSINTGTVFAVQEMGREIFLDYIKRFGFDRATEINLPGEVVGSFRSLIRGRDINYATASYGQGISVSPIRMLTAINAIANRGTMMVPRIIQGDSKIEGYPISEATAQKMVNIMVSSVEKNVLASIPGYSVAGKTGTALVPDFVRGGYRDAHINTYIGFAPAHDPKFSILIRLDEPEGNPLAGASVVPAFRELAEFILLYYNIAPDKLR